jgi:hypothetical protein
MVKQPTPEGGGRQRWRVEKSLDNLTSKFRQQVSLPIGFDAFGDDGKVQALANGLCRSRRLDYGRKDIANAALRLDYTWRIRVDLELASQTQDLDIDASVENVLVDSRCLKKHLPRERPLWRFEKREQQSIFAFGQRDRRAIRIDEATGAAFKRPAAKPVPASLRVARLRCAAHFVPPQDGADTRQHFPEAEWLC